MNVFDSVFEDRPNVLDRIKVSGSPASREVEYDGRQNNFCISSMLAGSPILLKNPHFNTVFVDPGQKLIPQKCDVPVDVHGTVNRKER
jgi:hypothetical protein